MDKYILLSDFVSLKKGKKQTESEKSENSIRYIQINDLRNDNNLKYTNDETFVFANDDDILIAWDGANAGTVGYGLSGAIGSTICAIKINDNYKDKIHSTYLGLFLKSQERFLRDRCEGATIPHLQRDVLLNLKLNLVDLKTQHHIAQTLDQATSLIEKRKAQIAELDKLVKAVFLEMFGDPATNPKKWEMSKLGDLISSQYGTSKKATTEKAEYPILRMNNITYSGEMDYSDIKYIDLDDKEKEKFLVHKGELLFNRTNSKELVGKTGLFELETPMAFAGYLIKITPSERLNAKFLVTYLNSDFIKKMLFNMAKNIIGMANINAKEMGSLPIFVPPLDLQTLFAQKVCKIEAEKDRLQRSLVEMENNLTALMGRFFG